DLEEFAGTALRVIAANVTARRVLFESDERRAILAKNEGTRIDLTDLVVRDGVMPVGIPGTEPFHFIDPRRDPLLPMGGHDPLDPYSIPDDGIAVYVLNGAAVIVTRALLEGNGAAGMLVHGEGSKASGSDIVVRNTKGLVVSG